MSEESLNLDHVVVNEDGDEVVELSIDEFKAIQEAIAMYQKENSLQEVHISQLKDRIEFLEKELQEARQNPQKIANSSLEKVKNNKNLRIISQHIS